ncbi:permease [Nitratidesulfovibrio sp. SRB-5]|uniref:permease n=1 Tax=Nitratidesulfovibrio sp. SRB-5 TaxID=2872636 RepID=UPI0010286549|nr:permease [Nitratidesulfovibrio sp. SRB-5]MBZ2173185.1 permease [Nitratidesulfovibrio sp. SRB-5]RXF76135.1 permease [Desulfovibrio sp. DS-1]
MDARLIHLAQTALAVFLEALPFLVLGSLVSACMEVFVPRAWVERRVPKSLPGALAFGVALGTVLPTCECGVVPVVRRMMGKGVPVPAAVAYMLAAPVVNPVVMVSTWVAFRGDMLMTGLRAAVVAATAVAVGISVRRMSVGGALRAHVPGGPDACGCGCGHDDAEFGHEHIPAEPVSGPVSGQGGAQAQRLPWFNEVQAAMMAAPAASAAAGAASPTLIAPAAAVSRAAQVHGVARHMTADLLDACAWLLPGALAAAAFRTFTPPEALFLFMDTPALAIPALMGLAVLLSVCSEADAFVAASFVGFPASARLAFVALGPMLDLKLMVMYGAAFRRGLVLRLVVLPTLCVWAACMLLAGLGVPE